MGSEINSKERRAQIKSALLQLAPAVLGLFIIFYRIVLQVYADSVGSNMINGHFVEISKGDFYGLAQKLNALSKGLSLDCFSLTVNDQTFMNINPSSSCSLWPINIQQIIRPSPVLEIIFWARLPKAIELTALAIFCAQVLIILLSILSTRAREKLKELYQNQLYAMAVQISHDIKSPLAVLKATLSFSSLGQINENNTLATRAIESIDQMALGLLSKYSQSSPTHLNFHLEEAHQLCSVSEILKEVLQEKKREKNTVINLSIAENSSNHFFKIDKISFKRILSNLINNCLEVKSTQINIFLNIEEEKCTLQIEDNGPGFSNQILQNINGHDSLVLSQKRGTGIGILSSQKQIEKWGGELILKNNKKGAEVKIILKRETVKNIFNHVHCDNDPLILLTWKVMAKKQNLNLLSLSSPFELKEQGTHPIALNAKIYLDYELGAEQNGLFWAHQLKEKNPGWAIYLTTGHSPEYFLGHQYFESVEGVISKSPTFF